MDKEFIPYEHALVLKELGFDEQCMRYYSSKNGGLLVLPQRISTMHNTKNSSVEKEYYCSAPLYQQAFRWFREKHNLDVTFRKMDYGTESQFTGYYFSVYRGNELIDIHGADKKCKAYEDSELECLKKLIELCKNN